MDKAINYAKLLKNGIPELIDSVKSGYIPFEFAMIMADLPKKTQKFLLPLAKEVIENPERLSWIKKAIENLELFELTVKPDDYQ